MKIATMLALCAVLVLSALPAAAAGDGLDDFIASINAEASADIGSFKVRLSAQFKTEAAKVEMLLKTVDKPADAYMVLRVAEVAKLPPEKVTVEYSASKDKGWGVIAKNLGIKPGSKEFHELKKMSKGEKGKGKGKGRGRDKD